MDYYLVDYENVGMNFMKEFDEAKEGDSIVIFYSERCKCITFDAIDSIMKKNIKLSWHKVETGTSNALDFQLSSFLGYLIGKESGNIKYHIVSNDKGFDCLCTFWKEQNKLVKRIGTQSLTKKEGSIPIVSTPALSKKKSNIASSDLATLEEIKEVLSKKDAPEVVLGIFNTYKTRQAICNGISKHFRDNNKTSEVYRKLRPLMKKKNKT